MTPAKIHLISEVLSHHQTGKYLLSPQGFRKESSLRSPISPVHFPHGDLLTFLIQAVFYFCEFFIQFHDLLRKPPYGFLPRCCAIFQTQTRFCVLYDFRSSAVAAPPQLCFMPDLPNPFCSLPLVSIALT